MNSPFVIEQSRRAAERLLAEPAEDHAARIERAYVRFLGRPPSSAERQLALQFLSQTADQQQTAEQQQSAWARFCQALYSCIDFRYLH